MLFGGLLRYWGSPGALRPRCFVLSVAILSNALFVLASRPTQLFCEEQRPLLKEAHPEAGFGELAKLLGAAWKDEANKEDYAVRAEVGAGQAPWKGAGATRQRDLGALLPADNRGPGVLLAAQTAWFSCLCYTASGAAACLVVLVVSTNPHDGPLHLGACLGAERGLGRAACDQGQEGRGGRRQEGGQGQDPRRGQEAQGRGGGRQGGGGGGRRGGGGRGRR